MQRALGRRRRRSPRRARRPSALRSAKCCARFDELAGACGLGRRSILELPDDNLHRLPVGGPRMGGVSRQLLPICVVIVAEPKVYVESLTGWATCISGIRDERAQVAGGLPLLLCGVWQIGKSIVTSVLLEVDLPFTPMHDERDGPCRQQRLYIVALHHSFGLCVILERELRAVFAENRLVEGADRSAEGAIGGALMVPPPARDLRQIDLAGAVLPPASTRIRLIALVVKHPGRHVRVVGVPVGARWRNHRERDEIVAVAKIGLSAVGFEHEDGFGAGPFLAAVPVFGHPEMQAIARESNVLWCESRSQTAIVVISA